MLAFIFFAYNIFKKIRDTNDNVFKLILTGLISLLLMQAFVHVGVNLSFITTGMTLPFASYGGSSIISISIVSGIILNLTKEGLLVKKILISTGGSGGHVVPALNLYQHLKMILM